MTTSIEDKKRMLIEYFTQHQDAVVSITARGPSLVKAPGKFRGFHRNIEIDLSLAQVFLLEHARAETDLQAETDPKKAVTNQFYFSAAEIFLPETAQEVPVRSGTDVPPGPLSEAATPEKS